MPDLPAIRTGLNRRPEHSRERKLRSFLFCRTRSWHPAGASLKPPQADTSNAWLNVATELWGLNESTLRKAIAYGKLVNGVDVCKFGKQWVVSIDAMTREYGVAAQ